MFLQMSWGPDYDSEGETGALKMRIAELEKQVDKNDFQHIPKIQI